MSVKTKGNRWCELCQRPTLAVKSTHRLRNTASVATAPLTAGLSLAAAKNDGYVCATCGGPTVAMKHPTAADALETDTLTWLSTWIARGYAVFAVGFAALMILALIAAIIDTILG